MRLEGSPSDRLREALDLFDFGVSMMAARLRREHPDESPEQLAQRLDAWLTDQVPASVGANAPPTSPTPGSSHR